MNILKAIHELKDTQSVSTEYGVLTRYDSGDMASYTLTWCDGSVTSGIIFLVHRDNPAFILERKPEPAYYALVRNRLFEYIFNHKEVQK